MRKQRAQQAAEKAAADKAAAAAPARRVKPVKPKTVPSAPPKTQYELERVWRDLKSEEGLGMLAEYIGTFKGATYKKVLKESINGEVISSLLAAADAHLAPDVAASMLSGIAKSGGFSMWKMMVSPHDTACVTSLLGRIRADPSLAGAEATADELAAAYGV